MMKRVRDEAEFTGSAMANCLLLLSRGGGFTEFNSVSGSPIRVFECKTCNRQFPSFQALGGHRASHKKPKTDGAHLDLELRSSAAAAAIAKPKTHECAICGVDFPIGQALGGHMRRHRSAGSENHSLRSPPIPFTPTLQLARAPIVKKTNSSRRILCLDLNLTPLENDLQFTMGKVASVHG